MAAALIAAAVAARALTTRVRSPALVVAAATVAVAGVRSIGSIWLPHVGDGLTRQHVTSIVIAATAGVVLAVVAASAARGHQPSMPPT